MTREQYLAYMKEYNRNHKRVKGSMSSVPFIGEQYDYRDLLVQPTGVNFRGSDKENPIVCSEFGCATHLTPEQQLYNSKCYSCQCKEKQTDVAMRISYPIKRIA